MISLPLALSLQRIMPTAPAIAACLPLSTLAVIPLRQAKIFPFTFFSSNVPGMHSRLYIFSSQLRIKVVYRICLGNLYLKKKVF